MGKLGIEAPTPRLTVGMPVYNNARTINRALDSLSAQTFADFRLVISDDGSTDQTADLCEEVAQADSRMTVVRQPRNQNYGNFRFVLRQASTRLFMFAAGDDYWHPTYIQRMIDALDATPNAVCAASRVVFVKDGAPVMEGRGTLPLTASPAENILRFLQSKDDNSRMYGVMRTDVARRAFPPTDFHAYDWAFSIGTLLEGIHIQVPEILIWRDFTEPERYVEHVRRDAIGTVSRIFPALPLTVDLLERLRIPTTPPIVRELLRMNLFFHREYLQRYHPGVANSQAVIAERSRQLAEFVGRLVR